MNGASPFLTAWSSFYVVTGSSAAALLGLMFVVVTLVASRMRSLDDANLGFATFSTPTVVHFCAAFLISGIVNAPWHSLFRAGTLIGFTGLFGVLYMTRVIFLTRRITFYQLPLEDWLWFAILPMIAYLAMIASAVFLTTIPARVLFALAGVTMLLIFIGIHNAWDVITYVGVDRSQDE
jgi:hypothetical protein